MTEREQDVRRFINEYFDRIHATMWGRAFALDQPDSRKKAVDWLATQIENVLGDRLV